MNDAPNDAPASEIARTGLIAAGVMLAAVTAFYGFGIATGSSLFFTHDIGGSDIWHLSYPMKHFYAQELDVGRLPLWADDVGTGFPLHAEGQVAALYPLNLILYKLLPVPLAFNWSILLHAILAGVFAAMYTRQMGAGRAGSLVAAAVFAFAGFFITHLKHINMTASAVWIPLLLLLLERYARRRAHRTLAAFAAVVGIMILAGHPQIWYYNLLVCGFYALHLLIRLWRRPPARGGGRTSGLRFAGGLGYAVALGLLLALPQILPSQELNDLGPRRVGLTIAEATQYKYSPKYLIAFLLPSYFGDPGELAFEPILDPRTDRPMENSALEGGPPPSKVTGFVPQREAPTFFWEMTGYVGLLPILLALACVALGFRQRRPRVLLVLLVLSIVMALGEHGGLFYLFYYAFPGFELFRFHARFLLYADLALAVMAGVGLTLLVARLPAARRKAAAGALAVLVPVVCAADIWSALGDHNPKIATERWTTTPVTAERMRQDAGGQLFRYARLDPARLGFQWAYYHAAGWKGDLSPYDAAKELLDDNLNLLYGLDNVSLYYKIRPRWMHELLEVLMPVTRRGRATVNPRVASIFGVRYLIDHEDALVGKFPQLRQFPGGPRYDVLPGGGLVRTGEYTLRIHKNPDVLPRAWLVPRARLVSDERPAVTLRGRPLSEAQRVLSTELEPREEVLITRQKDMDFHGFRGGLPGEAIAAPVVIVEHGPRRVTLRTEAPRDCWLFLSDTHYPGWSATVDGVETHVYRANLAGRAVRLSAGEHEIVFTYAPSSVSLGLLLAAVGALLLATLGWQQKLASRCLGCQLGG